MAQAHGWYPGFPPLAGGSGGDPPAAGAVTRSWTTYLSLSSLTIWLFPVLIVPPGEVPAARSWLC